MMEKMVEILIPYIERYMLEEKHTQSEFILKRISKP